MPNVSVWMLRLSLAYLITGASIGSLLLVNKAILISYKLWALLPVHIELLIFGWIIQFTLGTAYWILPRFLISKDRGSEFLAILMLISLNVGILLVILSHLFYQLSPLALPGRLLETLAVILFAGLHWKRIVSYANH